MKKPPEKLPGGFQNFYFRPESGVRAEREGRCTVHLVDIVAELHHTVASGPCGNVDKVQRNRIGKLDRRVRAGLDRAFDGLTLPARRILQQPDVKIANILNADTAGRVKAHELVE